MKKYFSIIACGALMLAGCAKETLVAPNDSKTVFTVGIQDESKTTLGELSEGKRHIYWSNGDVLNINGFDSEALADVTEGQQTAKFVFSPAPDAPYNMTYPASIYGGEGKVVLSGSPTVMPLYGVAPDSLHMNLSVLTGAAKFTLTAGNDSCKISYVEVIAAGKQLSGEFGIDYSTGALTEGTVTEENSKVRRSVKKVLTADEPVEVFIPIPAGTYSALTVRVVDTNGHYLDVNSTAAKTFEAGQIKAFPAIVFNPTGTLVDVEISSAAQWNEYATAYNAGTAKEGFVAITADLDFNGIDVVTIGSYKAENYYYGMINGNNHVIKNLHTTRSLVGAVAGDGFIKDLTIDETCSYTVPYGPDEPENGYFGPFANYLKGTLENCVNKASITLDVYRELDNTSDLYVGGIVGRIREGVAKNCTNYGTITFNETYNAPGKYAHAGGITGYMSNPAGTVTACANHGDLINHTCWANQVHMGGIVGYFVGATITDCTNDGDLTTDIEPRPAGDACKHISMAGIVGNQAGGTITGCTNSGNILSKSKVKLQYIGGIAGIVGGTVTNKDNTSSGNIHSTSNVRCPMIGGLYGRVDEDNSFEFSGKPFTGKIHLDTFESGDNTYVYVGGLIGICKGSATLTGIGAPVEGPDSVVIGNTASKSWRLSVGGIIGAIGETWSPLKDTLDLGDGGEPYVETYEKVTEGATAKISNFHNVGAVIQKGGSGIKPGSKIGSFGGIIGGMLCGGTIENCVNDGSVKYCESNSGSNSNGYPVHVGGILGRGDGSASVIRGCTNSGAIYNQLYNNNAFDIRGHRGSNCIGGIAGSFGYKPLSTATLTIEDCHSTGVMYAYRGAAGGIIGYANHTTVKNSTFKDNTIKRGSPVGGVIGAGENSAVEGCTVKVTELKGTSGGSTSGDCGGIIGDARGCSADGCRFFGTITSDKLMGGIFGKNDANCTIGTKAMCTYGGKVGDADIDDIFYIMYYVGASELIEVDITTQIGYWDGTL